VAHDRRVALGVAGFLAVFAPLLFLPGRVFDAYMYLPFALLAVAVGGIFTRFRAAWVVAFALLWIPWNYKHLRRERQEAIAAGHENRAYVAGIERFVKSGPVPDVVLHDGVPHSMMTWGVAGALHYFSKKPHIEVWPVDHPEGKARLESRSLAVLMWDSISMTMYWARRGEGEVIPSFLVMRQPVPYWRLTEGWYGREGYHRWSEPVARLRLDRPPDAGTFEIWVQVVESQVRQTGPPRVEVLIDGRSFGERAFSDGEIVRQAWNVAAAPTGPVEVELRTTPAYTPGGGDVRRLGVAVVGIGFR
jgi:hypothetical protein